MQDERGRRIIWSHVCIYCFSGVIILSEKAAIVLCFMHYHWMGTKLLAWLTLGLCLPATAVQLLSLKWCVTDEAKCKPSLILVHCLHLGIFHRLWLCMKPQVRQVKFGALLMQQADVSALCLIEAMTLSLPQSLLQTYSLFTFQTGFLSQGELTLVALCVGLNLLNVSWFLALYSRSCLLLRPGHLHMTPAAMLSQLLWRGGMLGARVASLMFFCSMFHWWTCGVVGFHWFIMTFWLVCQQTDICINQNSWHLFNVILGTLHIFLFLNVKDSPSRYRMAGFYLLMLLENTFLLLLASDSLTEPSWESMSIPAAVLCSFFIGVIFVILHYRFLHPKSTEILQSLRLSQISLTINRTASDIHCKDTTAESTIHRQRTFSMTGIAPSLGDLPETCSVQPLEGCSHHHHILICLALKTGNSDKISFVYGGRGLSAFQENEDIRHTGSGLKDCNKPSLVPGENFESFQKQTTGDRIEAKHCEGLSKGKQSPDGEYKMVKGAVYDTCPADSSSTIYFSAEAHSPCSLSDAALEKENIIISPIINPVALHLTSKELLNREPCYTSTPIPDLKTIQNTSPRQGGVRRHVRF